MHKVRVFFEQVVIPVVDTGVVALSEPDIKIANAFEQLRGNVILLAFYLRGLGSVSLSTLQVPESCVPGMLSSSRNLLSSTYFIQHGPST